jgi:hypothetical protein
MQPKPADCFDMSGIPLDEFADTIVAIHAHQKNATLWFGYLDGWMLSPREEVVLRIVIRDFPCHVISLNPHSFSHSWKNEIDTIYTNNLNNGLPNTHDNGSSIHNGGKAKH